MPPAEPTETGKSPPRLGSYQIIEPLGAGGMSSVFRARHTDSGHEVAVKVLPRAFAKNPTLLQRFLREARNAEALEHPNIASIYDRGFDQGRHYLVLEFVEGGDLNDRVRKAGPMEVGEAIRTIRSVALGLRYALKQGVIHRDVKPANLLMTPAGQIKIIDLGLALQTESEDERVTRDGTTVGTVDYMAPEQARDSRATSERSDIYSLGCTFYYLLTGTPPFAGGDVVDKLGRHCTAPIPDVRDSRPEASEPLALLIQRMMAKKPEGRFAGYDQLIAAIDALPEVEAIGVLPEATMDALLVDDEEDNPADDGSGGLALVSNAPAPPPRRDATSPNRPAPLEVSLAELAALDGDDEPSPRSASRRPRSAALGPDFLDDEPLGRTTAAATTPTRGGTEVPLRTWVAAGAALGLAIALLGYGTLQLVGPASDGASLVAESGEEPGPGEPPPPEVAAGVPAPEVFVPKPVAVANTPLSKPKPTTPPAPAWVEPADRRKELPPEPAFPPELEGSYTPDWAAKPIVATVDGPTIVLRRTSESPSPDEVTTLRQALDRTTGAVEIADDGPFLEDDLRVAGKSRLIRARPGFRPMIKVEASPSALVRDRPGIVVLDGVDLTLDGLDLVVDARSIPPSQSAVFVLRGARLTLRGCTVSVVHGSGRTIQIVRVDDPPTGVAQRSSTVRVEGSLLTGTTGAVFDLGTAGRVFVSRSIAIGGGPIVAERASTSPGPRRATFVRSVLATRGPFVEVPGSRVPTMEVSALGCTFARVGGGEDRPLLSARGELGGSIPTVIAWSGHTNTYRGWPAWLATGTPPSMRVADLTAAREVWRSTDETSVSTGGVWPALILDAEPGPDSLAALPDFPAPILARAAMPSPSLIPAAVGVFARQPIPDHPDRPVVSPGGAGGQREMVNSGGAMLRPGVRPADAAGVLRFSANDPAWRGDLGRFLAKSVPPGSGRVRVAVEGTGTWAMTPVKLPEGVSVEIDAGAARDSGPVWYPSVAGDAAALISTVGGDLTLKGITLVASPSSRVGRLVLVVDGHLRMERCHFRSGGSASADFAMVGFRTTGSRPLEPPRAGSFRVATDLPTCQIVDSLLEAGGGEAVSAELGRGVVSLFNTVLIGGGDACLIHLKPEKIASHRLLADLDLDRCTLAAEGDMVRIGDWPGAAPGPDRSWLVSTSRCAFIEVPRRGRRETVLLRSPGEGLAHAALSWQAVGDAYDLTHFTATGASTPAIGRARPDVKARWVDYWGPRHIVGVTGPTPRRTEPVLKLAGRERLQAGEVPVDALAIDPRLHPDLGADLGPMAALRAKQRLLPRAD